MRRDSCPDRGGIDHDDLERRRRLAHEVLETCAHVIGSLARHDDGRRRTRGRSGDHDRRCSARPRVRRQAASLHARTPGHLGTAERTRCVPGKKPIDSPAV